MHMFVAFPPHLALNPCELLRSSQFAVALPHFCLIAAVSWQKATIFALWLSEHKLQIIYLYTHVHTLTHALTHTPSHAARCKVGNKNFIVFFLRRGAAAFAFVDLPRSPYSHAHCQLGVAHNKECPYSAQACFSAWLPDCLLCLSGPKVILTKIPSVGIICISCGSHSLFCPCPSRSLSLSVSFYYLCFYLLF